MNPARILLVDDDESLLTLLSMRLEASGYETLKARNADEALGQLQAARPQLAIVDLRLTQDAETGSTESTSPESTVQEEADGIALFKRMCAVEPLLPVIILTAHGTIPDAVAATRSGVAAFLTKPFDGRALVAEVQRLLALRAPSPEAATGWRSKLVTRNRVMLGLIDEIARIAQHDATVLVQGPSGSGKELVARAIHEAGPRATRPFVALNCAAMPEALLESELFGHVKGAFTGAVADSPGLLRSAEGGTVLLDEIGDMPLALQAKLLRVLQERKVRPVGGAREFEIDVRVIAATHRDLAQAIRDGQFREDLFYRLNVVRLALPALEARREDVPLLAQHFLRSIAVRYQSQATTFSADALEALSAAAWPGNVRQLFNVVEQCVVLADTPVIAHSLVTRALLSSPLGHTDQPTGIPSLADARGQFERDYLVQLLKLTEGNITQAARLAKRNRTEFYRLIEKHGLAGELFR